MQTKALLFLLLSFLIINSSIAQLSSAEIDQLVEDAIQKFDVAGTAVAIVKDGKIVHQKGYGIRSLKSKAKVDEHTLFAIASNSKAFTTTALAILVEDKKLEWTDKVIDHIPEFKMYNDYVTQNFNIQDLLTHRSGLGLGAGDLMFFPDGADFTIEDVAQCFQYFEPQSAFRTKFDYDNLLYYIAGEIIARVSGMSWEAFVKKEIMSPLGMESSAGAYTELRDLSNVANPHSTEKGDMVELDHFIFDTDKINGAAGGIYASVNDLANWMLVHLNKGKYGPELKHELFTEASQREMWKIHTTLEAGRNPRYNSHFDGYGLGWGLQDIKGNLQVSHTGGLPGMLSVTIMIPDLNFGVVVLTNTSNGGAGVFISVSRTIVDSYLGLDDYGWVDKAVAHFAKQAAAGDSVTQKVWETVDAADASHIRPEDFEGSYVDDWFGEVEVINKDGKLWFRSIRSPKLTGLLRYYKANAFAIKWAYQDMNADAFAIFNLDEEGKAQGIKMKGISPNIDFSFDFQDLDFKRTVKE